MSISQSLCSVIQVYISLCVCVCLLYPSGDHFPWLYYKFWKWDNFPSSSHYSYWSVCMHVCVVSHIDEQMSRWKTSLQYQWAIQLSTWEFFQWAISCSPHLSVLQCTNHWQISLSIKHRKQVPPNTIPIYTQIIQNETKSTKPTSKGHRINSSKPSKNHIIHQEIKSEIFINQYWKIINPHRVMTYWSTNIVEQMLSQLTLLMHFQHQREEMPKENILESVPWNQNPWKL